MLTTCYSWLHDDMINTYMNNIQLEPTTRVLARFRRSMVDLNTANYCRVGRHTGGSDLDCYFQAIVFACMGGPLQPPLHMCTSRGKLCLDACRASRCTPGTSSMLWARRSPQRRCPPRRRTLPPSCTHPALQVSAADAGWHAQCRPWLRAHAPAWCTTLCRCKWEAAGLLAVDGLTLQTLRARVQKC